MLPDSVVTVHGVGPGVKDRHSTTKVIPWFNEFLERFTQTTKFPNNIDIYAGISSAGVQKAAFQLLDEVRKATEHIEVTIPILASGHSPIDR
jgi:hypothetical protein